MLSFGHHPQLIIYGTAPRDFMDSTLSDPTATEPFRYLKRFVPLPEAALDFYRVNLNPLDYWLQNVFYLYDHALDFQLAFSRRLNSVLETLLPAPVNGVPFTSSDRLKLLPKYKALEFSPGSLVNRPLVPESAKVSQRSKKWQRDNTEDYIERYRRPNAESFNLQLKFLNRLFALCHEEKIELVLVNMPLSSVNINLLGRRRYENFSNIINCTCRLSSVKYIDLSNTVSFDNELFQDCAHLTGIGAKQFIDLLTERMKKDSQLSAVLDQAGKTFSEKQAIAARNRVNLE